MVVACDDLYGGTYHLFGSELKSFGIDMTFVSFSGLVEMARKNNVISMIDNTFATPYLIQPYVQGVNVVIHSATKYIAGHSDVTAGIVAGDQDMVQRAKEKMANLGCNLGPFDAWLAGSRMERQVKNAAALAQFMKSQQAIKKVYYPESASTKGNGAIVTVELDEKANIEAFFRHLSWVKLVATLAGVETSASYPLGTSHRNMPDELIKQHGLTKHVVRISVGIEDIEDIQDAFSAALNQSM